MTSSTSFGGKIIGLAVLLLMTTFSAPLFAKNSVSSDGSIKEQGKLKNKISSANNKLEKSRAVSNSYRKSFVTAEENLSKASRKLHRTNQRIKRLSKKLKNSNKQKSKLLKQTEDERQALAKQLVAHYTSGKQSYLRLLLREDDPSDLNRTFKYYSYLNNYRIKRIETITKQLDDIKVLQAGISTDKVALTALQKEQSTRKATLRSAVNEKERSYKKQKKIVLSQKQSLAKLKKSEARLKGVIQRLAKKQKREEKARKAKKKKAKALALAKKQKEIKRQKEKKQQSVKKAKKVTIVKKQQQVVDRHYVPNKKFSSLKGKLSWPVSGSISHKYGSVRNSREKWKAIVISARGGSKVHAVARGKVEFAGKLKGYGYLIIIRHDSSYRSIYGYNRSIYKKEGDVVKAGEVIAAVGNSGGIKNTGLYFEIRKGSYHQNPTRWIRR